jgi:uncharacterized membrane protein
LTNSPEVVIIRHHKPQASLTTGLAVLCFLVAKCGGYWLRRILRRGFGRKCAGFCAAFRRPLEVRVRHLQIVLGRYWLAVANPSTDHMQRVFRVGGGLGGGQVDGAKGTGPRAVDGGMTLVQEAA